MTNVLIDIILVGIVAFVARKRGGSRRVANPAGPLQATGFVPREPSKAVSQAAPTDAAPTSQTDIPVALPAYLLSGQRAAGRGDSMAETLAMMAGPGICTPRPR